jgi:hypothetical protein
VDLWPAFVDLLDQRRPGGSPSATGTGYASTFAAAGFVEVARRSPERPIMRLSF